MGNRLPPSRKLAAVRMTGGNAMSQLEAHSILKLMRGDEMTGQERAAAVRGAVKLGRALYRAQRLSIPKGLRERPLGAPTMYDEE